MHSTFLHSPSLPSPSTGQMSRGSPIRCEQLLPTLGPAMSRRRSTGTWRHLASRRRGVGVSLRSTLRLRSATPRSTSRGRHRTREAELPIERKEVALWLEKRLVAVLRELVEHKGFIRHGPGCSRRRYSTRSSPRWVEAWRSGTHRIAFAEEGEGVQAAPAAGRLLLSCVLGCQRLEPRIDLGPPHPLAAHHHADTVREVVEVVERIGAQ